jgi:hypothetical protein
MSVSAGLGKRFVKVKDSHGNEWLCPLDAMKNVKDATQEELDDSWKWTSSRILLGISTPSGRWPEQQPCVKIKAPVPAPEAPLRFSPIFPFLFTFSYLSSFYML